MSRSGFVFTQLADGWRGSPEVTGERSVGNPPLTGARESRRHSPPPPSAIHVRGSQGWVGVDVVLAQLAPPPNTQQHTIMPARGMGG